MKLRTIEETATQLGISPRTLYGWHWRRKDFPFIKLGRTLRVDEDELIRFIQKCRVKTAKEGE